MWGPSVSLNTTFHPFATYTLSKNDHCVHLLACCTNTHINNLRINIHNQAPYWSTPQQDASD